MTFDCKDWCRLAEAAEYEDATPREAGQAGALAVALLRRGACAFYAGAAGESAAEKGCLVLAPAPLRLLPEGRCQLAVLSLAGAAPEALAEELAAPALLRPVEAPGAEDLVARLVAGGPPEESGALAYTLLCRLAAGLAGRPPLPALVAAALAEIREHYAEVYGVEELAAGLMVSKSHLIRQFTAALGQSPGKVLTAVRLENAKRLLAGGAYSLHAVAGLCGFSGANYLCKVFKKETGESPAAWRRRNTAPAPSAEWAEQLYL